MFQKHVVPIDISNDTAGKRTWRALSLAVSSVVCARATSSSASAVGDGLVDAVLSAPDVKVGQRTLPVARATPHVE